ncbi:MAG TPA: MFS transporter [Puia sp.]|uniref:MFS transporter n=1 Tax=Puia sp. TaxID=2045100 RepID=UPI002CDEB00F|nr:MFS transporter [Puia sp.]HVU99132.1 MFS transporter [Puia sp.]
MTRTASKRVINGWAMYDWANSVYNLVITTTFFPIYFTKATAHHFRSDSIPFLGLHINSSSLYSFALAAAYLVIALLYPVLTSIADTRGNKKRFMQFFCYMGAMGCSALFLFDGGNVGLGVLCFILASMGYVGSQVFYNAYLPEIAAPEDQDRVSARGFSYGYIGSVLMQLIGFAIVMLMPEQPFLSLRLNFLLVGLWWAGFAQFTFAVLPKAGREITAATSVFKVGFAEVRKVYAEVKKLAVLKRYLRGFFFYSIGVQTVMTVATLFGSVLLKLDDTKLIVTIVLVQLVAILGATWMGKLSARFGNIRVLMGVVAFWILICVSAFITAGQAEHLKPFHDTIAGLQQQKEDLEARKGQMTAEAFDSADANVLAELSRWRHDLEPHQQPIEYSFYMLALGVGLVMGGIQSLSRSTYSKLMPPTKDTASYFSYYDLTEKIAIVIGMFTFGFVSQMTGTMKNAIVFLIVFFILGLVFLFSAQARQNREPAPAV